MTKSINIKNKGKKLLDMIFVYFLEKLPQDIIKLYDVNYSVIKLKKNNKKNKTLRFQTLCLKRVFLLFA